MSMTADESQASDVEALVRSRLAEAHFPARPDEVALFVMMYPLLRAKADRVFELDLGDQP
jgi:hypothetical protein